MLNYQGRQVSAVIKRLSGLFKIKLILLYLTAQTTTSTDNCWDTQLRIISHFCYGFVWKLALEELLLTAHETGMLPPDSK